MLESEDNNTAAKGSADLEMLLGEYLKTKRQDKNFSLEKLSQKTKISINILKSLEANDFDHLPSAAYIKGFVISYVKVLGLPIDEAINKMEYTYLNLLGKPFPALNHTKLLLSTSQILPRDEDQNPHQMIEKVDSILENTKSVLPLIIFVGVILGFIGGYKILATIIDSEISDQKSKDLGPKIESSSALVHAKKDPHLANPSAAIQTSGEKERLIITRSDQKFYKP